MMVQYPTDLLQMKTWGWGNIAFLGPFQKILQLWIVPNQKKAQRFYLKDDVCPNFHIYTPIGSIGNPLYESS